jgi:hypothetical protein
MIIYWECCQASIYFVNSFPISPFDRDGNRRVYCGAGNFDSGAASCGAPSLDGSLYTKHGGLLLFPVPRIGSDSSRIGSDRLQH